MGKKLKFICPCGREHFVFKEGEELRHTVTELPEAIAPEDTPDDKPKPKKSFLQEIFGDD